jgi:two-component sensor histidine kinase
LQRQSAEHSEAEARSAAATAEAQYQEVLLRELQHRVKNNFQVILASIAIQKRRFNSAEAQRALSHIESRINAISLAHDQLTPRHGQTIGLAAYIRALCASIEQQADGIAVDLDADEVELAIDRAVPLGLILNEAATNSIKHAFGNEGGRINIILKGGIGYGEAQLTVSDNGRGIKPNSAPGTGLRLIASLARQIGAMIEQTSSDKGALLRVTFPVIV